MNQENDFEKRLEKTVLHPLTHTTRLYRSIQVVLFAIVCWGAYAFSLQMRKGLVVTDMRDYVLWGLYISNFVFFIGISHAGTLISAILRVTHAGWRTPITRIAEFVTVVALSVGGLMPVIDMGRPLRVGNLILHGRFQAPIVWDIMAITTYLTASLIYLFLPMVEDLALCRDKMGKDASPWRRTFYRVLSLGWSGKPSQKRRLIVGMGMMAVLIIPIAVSVHTVVSFIFAMTLRPGWDSTVFGIYFVAGAIFSGIATLIIIMAVLRRAFHFEEYITKKHFMYLGYLLGAFVLIMAYFNLLDFLVPGYKMQPGEQALMGQYFTGQYAPFYWFYVVGGLVIPGIIILNPKTRTIKGIVVASILINVAMWIERFLIVVPTLKVAQMPHATPSYSPSWVEWSVIAGAVSAFALLISVFAKLFPMISVWEVKEHHELETHAEAGTELVKE